MVKKLPRILVLHGPNLNMLGQRETDIYGQFTLRDVETLCQKTGKALGFQVDCRQSNHEGELVTWIQKSRTAYQGIVINAGAYTHTSVAILDALKIAQLPLIEVHISNIFARERFRHVSFISTTALGVIAGLGLNGYIAAVQSLAAYIKSHNRK